MSKQFIHVRDIDPVGQNILEKRYFHPGETTWHDVAVRVVDYVLGRDDPDYDETLAMLENAYFIPNSPTLVNAGKPNGGLSACFVLPFEDTIEDIYKTKLDYALIARKGGGCGTTLSFIRPEGSPVAGSAHGYAGGPIKFYDTVCGDMSALTQSGFRPMAMMGVMTVYHPDIMKFINAKEKEGVMTTTNISVMVDNAFMQAVENDGTYWTEFNGVKYEELRARDVFNTIVEGAWRNGEPGMLFFEKTNNSPYKYSGQTIYATNPCGEQGLPPYGVCNLGSLDVSKFITPDNRMDWELMEKAVRLSVRFLDKVITVNTFPTKEITDWAAANRPVGTGIMGYADYLLKRGIAYGSQKSLVELESIMGFIYTVAEDESVKLGKELGVPEACQVLPVKRRNVTLLSIAPTGTISLLAGCSSGIEPIFSELMVRTDNTGTYNIHHPMFEQEHFRCAVSANGAKEVTWEEHIAVQNAAQRFVDSGVSKTINCANGTRRETVAKMFMEAWKTPYIKGLTVYRNGSRQVEVLQPKNIKKDKCPVCDGNLVKEGGCTHCENCDFSLCEIG